MERGSGFHLAMELPIKSEMIATGDGDGNGTALERIGRQLNSNPVTTVDVNLKNHLVEFVSFRENSNLAPAIVNESGGMHRQSLRHTLQSFIFGVLSFQLGITHSISCHFSLF